MALLAIPLRSHQPIRRLVSDHLLSAGFFPARKAESRCPICRIQPAAFVLIAFVIHLAGSLLVRRAVRSAPAHAAAASGPARAASFAPLVWSGLLHSIIGIVTRCSTSTSTGPGSCSRRSDSESWAGIVVSGRRGNRTSGQKLPLVLSGRDRGVRSGHEKREGREGMNRAPCLSSRCPGRRRPCRNAPGQPAAGSEVKDPGRSGTSTRLMPRTAPGATAREENAAAAIAPERSWSISVSPRRRRSTGRLERCAGKRRCRPSQGAPAAC